LNITKNFIYLLSFGILILIVAIFLQSSLTFFILYNLLCATLLLIDFFISPSIEMISIQRIGDEKLNIYESEKIKLEEYNKSDFVLYMQLKDEIPEFHFKCNSKIMKGKVLPHEKKEFHYIVQPTKRGAFSFKNIHVKYDGRLKLCSLMFKINLCTEYKVYPNLKNLRKFKLSIQSNKTYRQGYRALATLGKGTSFESLRDYVSGDEYRKINWKATARENRPIVNQYEPEKNQHVYIFIDTGRPMSYKVQGFQKLDLAINASLILSDIVNQNEDKCGALLFNTEVQNMIMPSKGVVHRNKILETLYHVESTRQTSNYDDAFYYFKKKEQHRSIIFLFTDFETIEEAENMMKVLPLISKNNIVVIILIKNESILKMVNNDAKDTEEIFNKGVALELISERHRIIKLINKRGILCMECLYDNLEYTAINKYMELKNKSYL